MVLFQGEQAECDCPREQGGRRLPAFFESASARPGGVAFGGSSGRGGGVGEYLQGGSDVFVVGDFA